MSYKLGSLFDGSGGFPLAGFLCGIEPIWASEIEPYPIAVTKTRFPKMKHLGDIGKIKGAEIEPVDVITFGSPCQDLSVAGKRAGLKHEGNGDDETTRSGLFMEAVRIIKEMREKTNGEYPRYAVWENVPGAFSSNKGEDFRIVLEELIKIIEPTAIMPEVPRFGWAYADSYCGDGWSLAYRVFDAQYWGVPQRRRRIYLVADFGGQRAREILFEREGLRGYFTEGRTPWQAVAADVERCVGAADSERNCTAYSFDALSSNSMKSSNPYSGCRQVEIAKCLDTADPNPSKNQGGIAVVEAFGFDGYNSTDTGHIAATLGVNCDRSTGRNGVIYGVTTKGNGDAFISEERHTALSTGGGQAGQGYPCVMVPYTLKIRSGCEGGGKGALIQTDMSATIATNNDQYLFQPIAAGFKEHNSPEARSIGYELERSPTLSANKHDAAVCVKCYDARGNGDGETVNTLTGDHENRITDYTSVVVSKETIALEGNGQRPSYHGDGYLESDKSYTLNATEVHGVTYGLDRASFNQGKNAKFDFSVSKEQQPTITAKGPGAVAYSFDPGASRDVGVLFIEECGKTLTNGTCPGHHDGDVIAMNETNPVLTASKASFFMNTDENLASTLVATDYKDPQLVAFDTSKHRYIVRRLTPTECARLQGFADRWGNIDPKTDFTDEEYRFWLEVRNTHAAINGKAVKEYNKKQMLTWYNKLHTDSAEYKLWGNGIALPTALYVIQGIAKI